MDWELGSESESQTDGGGYVPAGIQHAVDPYKRDLRGGSQVLAPCGADVRRWPSVAWSDRVGDVASCDECIRFVEAHPTPSA
jgi:hypothetical protein